MNINISILFYLILAQNIYSQDYDVDYKVIADNVYNTSKPDTLPVALQQTFEKAKKNFKFIKYKLYIKDNESIFFLNENMINDAHGQMKISIALAGFNGSVYTNLKEDLKLRNRHTYGQEFLVKSHFDEVDWNLTSQTKKIGGYLTYKAVAEQHYYRASGEKKTRKIIAWFTPEINAPFGPLGYGNLPGLILELSLGGKTYMIESLKQVKLEPNSIKKPKEGKKVSKKEFEDIGSNISFN